MPLKKNFFWNALYHFFKLSYFANVLNVIKFKRNPSQNPQNKDLSSTTCPLFSLSTGCIYLICHYTVPLPTSQVSLGCWAASPKITKYYWLMAYQLRLWQLVFRHAQEMSCIRTTYVFRTNATRSGPPFQLFLNIGLIWAMNKIHIHWLFLGNSAPQLPKVDKSYKTGIQAFFCFLLPQRWFIFTENININNCNNRNG